MNLSEKLKKARLLINETQAIASANSGVSQRDISFMEAGKKDNVPTGYLFYLHKKGFDLNSLFDEAKELETIENNLEQELAEVKKLLQEKEEMVSLLKDAVQLRDKKLKEAYQAKEKVH